MDDENNLMKFPHEMEENLSNIPWTRGLAAGSLLVGALLLVTGRRAAGLAIAAAGASVALLENPEAVQKFWDAIPDYVHSGQDFLGRAENLIDEVNRQGNRLRSMISHEG